MSNTPHRDQYQSDPERFNFRKRLRALGMSKPELEAFLEGAMLAACESDNIGVAMAQAVSRLEKLRGR